MTLANRITVFRALLSAAALCLLQFALFDRPNAPLLDACTVLVMISAVLDVADGAIARRRGQVTTFGRVLDPLVDKILICGCFITFLGLDALDGIVEPWVPVVIVVREFAVHAVRLDVEGLGVPFGASLWGKQKTFFQTVAAIGCLVFAAHLNGLESRTAWKTVLLILVGLAVASTVLSGILYGIGAVRVLREADRST